MLLRKICISFLKPRFLCVAGLNLGIYIIIANKRVGEEPNFYRVSYVTGRSLVCAPSGLFVWKVIFRSAESGTVPLLYHYQPPYQ